MWLGQRILGIRLHGPLGPSLFDKLVECFGAFCTLCKSRDVGGRLTRLHREFRNVSVGAPPTCGLGNVLQLCSPFEQPAQIQCSSYGATCLPEAGVCAGVALGQPCLPGLVYCEEGLDCLQERCVDVNSISEFKTFDSPRATGGLQTAEFRLGNPTGPGRTRGKY